MALVAGGDYSSICHKTPIEFTMVTKFSKKYAKTKFHVAQEFFPGGYTWGFPKVVLGIVHFQVPFFILFLGAGGGALLFLLELLTSRL
ncbi:hypothetical protein Pcinc_018777 [Petrolisthes cinctipes]|uniref:Uncharacterized protein n=1 Tax=Petrolisthes cinctipes TaxID=88211 RepID=A0AAE1FMH8_PETCI|nr:hypothetical protein Pcinc_018777 [Petrolisthes cinctipes]